MTHIQRHTVIIMACLSITTLLVTPGCRCHAQAAITFLGGDIQRDSSTLSYSAGQPAVLTSQARAITVVTITEQFTEGVQQPHLGVDATLGLQPLSVEVAVYPNPTTALLTIKSAGGLRYRLLDLQGRTLLHGRCHDTEQQLDLQGLANGTYLLHLTDDDGTHANRYRIIKTH